MLDCALQKHAISNVLSAHVTTTIAARIFLPAGGIGSMLLHAREHKKIECMVMVSLM